MRIIAVGDIHGNNDVFRKALKSFSLKKTDLLIILGDLIDRGNYSKEVLDTLFLLIESGFKNIICLKGNHEQLLLDSIEDENKEYIWLKNGGDKTLKSFKVNFANQIPKKYIDFIKTFKNYYIHENTIFVHAGINFEIDNPLDDQASLLWLRHIDETKLLSSEFKNFTIVHGHTPKTKDLIIDDFNNKKQILCLDNGVYFKENNLGNLVIADLTNNKINFIENK